ncbi:DNA polymerase III subunit gamma/tau [Rhizobium sp. TRM95796]|uniref:DNA polymerase III subunit gamma/tau n=1 Tax=Rhizobium sp. TRM95796 TaxID=2979862 RepID=UPI0021E8A8B4|nr:DNA polymerase III subunit gamma/tau [Rhizobium sp. TRM95796]MCV3766887.1 DNA polymerase III subunit gamma/tau [Rhizobium sp. TRM95796]
MSAETDKTGYRVLARKYRPKDFSDLMVGQEAMVRTLTNAFETGRIAQAYMLTGVRGVGKTTTARILARALNYKTETIDKPTIDLREPGLHCQAIMEGRHVDVIEMDAASHTGIDDIREIIEQVRYKPASARYKVYIIDEVHMLSTAAFNGLLKTLEEPPEHVKFIFATTEIRKVPVTVLSRCQRFDLRRISAADLTQLFSTIAEKEGVRAETEALALIARAAEGSARDGLSLMDQAIAHGAGVVETDAVRAMLGLADRARIADLFGHVVKGDVAAALNEFSEQYAAGANPVVVLNDLADFTHLVTRLKYIPDAANDPSLSEIERVQGAEFAKSIAVTALSRIWQMLLKGIPETENASRPFGAAEMVLIRLAHAGSLPSPEDAARRLAGMINGDVAAPAPAPRGGNGGGAQAMAVSDNRNYQSMAPSSPSGGATMLRAVPSSSPQPMQDLRPSPAARADDAPKINLRTFADVAQLAGDKRDMKLKAQLRQFVRPVRMEPGKIELALSPDAPKSLVGELSTRLREWTGQHWLVVISREPGGLTLVEAEAKERDDRVADARADPDVAAILARYPGAKITDVRVTAAPDDDNEDAVATDEALDDFDE